MAEHVLDYNHAITPQEKGWDCGPAATQVVLDGRGITATEDQLIREIGTTTNGTDDISWIETRALDRRLPEANYTRVYLTNDPPTRAQTEALWANIVRSINAGYGVIMNWVSPPSNRPRGVKGSTSPNYGGSTVYHYVACMGYDDETRSLWIADSGFRPYGYWVSLDNAATLIPPKGYCYANVTSAADRPAQVLAAATGLDFNRAATLLPAIQAGLVAAECTNPNRIAMWLAQVGHESDGFNATEEYDNGDGGVTERWLYKGRTWIQITWKSNYAGFGQWAYAKGLLRSPNYFVEHPTDLAALEWAGLGPAWYWTVARPDINALSDARDLVTVTRRINGGTNGLDIPGGRRDRYNRALAQGDALLEILTDGDDMFTDADRDLLKQIAGYRRPSKSPLRHVGEGDVNTCAGFAWTADGNIHVLLVERLASVYGDPDAIALLEEVAGADLTKYPDRADDAKLAQRILDKITSKAQADQ
ncbi:C39 family peptidase [Mycolicibacterium fortuitum]|uniref:C39 family peptidase n=1 Tax=Mycolicibacterium fortuitum TaxID=1766 RepID=UPI002638367D|nr:C39 family peptidase [Mycolicibacterium fortuitum]